MHMEGILPKGPYPPCLRMADKALFAGYRRHDVDLLGQKIPPGTEKTCNHLCRTNI